MTFMPDNLGVSANPKPKCTCGRSPTEYCVGLHLYTDEQAKEQLDIYYKNLENQKLEEQ